MDLHSRTPRLRGRGAAWSHDHPGADPGSDLGRLALGAVSNWPQWPKQPTRRGPVLAAGLILLISYSLIVVALTTDPVAYVVSFRQLSILITALLSMIWIERQVPRVRLVAVGVIFVGVVLVGLAV